MQYHYTYRITNNTINKHYYGSRTSKIHPKMDLGIRYFSSSTYKNFIKDQKENPQNYTYKVVYIFSTRKKAIFMEIKLHNKFNVGINESFYNKVKQSSTGFDTTGISSWNKGLSKDTNSTVNSIARKMKNIAYNRDEKYYNKTSRDMTLDKNPMYNKKHTKESKLKIGLKSAEKFLYYTEEKRKTIKEKTHNSMTIVEKNGKTKMENSHLKQVNTSKTTIRENGLTIEQNSQLKRVETIKKNGSNIGVKNSMTKPIIIEDANGKEIGIMLITELYRWCKEFNVCRTYVKKVIDGEHNFLFEEKPQKRYYNEKYYGYTFKIK